MIKIELPEISELTKCGLKQLPERKGVYFIFNRQDELIYIGMSTNIKRRISAHFSNNSPIQNKDEIFVASFTLYDDKMINLESVERIYISIYKPKYNDIRREPHPYEIVTPQIQAWALKNVPMR